MWQVSGKRSASLKFLTLGLLSFYYHAHLIVSLSATRRSFVTRRAHQTVTAILFETDWLASRPVFYSEHTGTASHNINDVVDHANLEIDPEGVNNYLDFGYSVLEQTPIKHVKFLRHSSRLVADNQGKLRIQYLPDPVERWLDYRLSERDLIDLVKERVRRWERSVEGEIVIPTSGGYDSRLLNYCIEDKSRVRAFTYGISERQADSYEVVYARRLSEILGTRWDRIPLGSFHQYFEDWDRLFGVSTHAHGMYHFEFHNRILSCVKGGNPFLSGLNGDVSAGSTSAQLVESYHHLNRLGLTRDINVDIRQSVHRSESPSREAFWKENRKKLADERYQVLFTLRFKMILMCYLLTVPAFLGFEAWSPFLDIDVCMAMLNLPMERRRERVWQKDFFRKSGLDLESMNLKCSAENTLDLQAMRTMPVKPLDGNLLSEVIQPSFVEWINKRVRYGWREKITEQLLHVPRIRGLLTRLGFSNDVGKRNAYNAYCVLLPIENLLRKRNLAIGSRSILDASIGQILVGAFCACGVPL